ncbi:uncharacterized protein [Misgurnus anguillicaudatus]|uniref:uncharacterized protein n=1 Tax=Misgurnus anguillicaudatus TaxID=75329 RepID=UPI003CCF7D30
MFALFSLICLLVIPGMCSQNWTVKYINRVKCALKGSTTLLFSNFTYPDGHNITKIFWTIDPVNVEETPDLSEDPEYKGRVKYILDKKQNFILKLSNITDEDEHMYYMKIVTNVENEKYLGRPGIKLKVTELRVEVYNEGNSTVLFCKTTCNLTISTNFTWYKNKSPLSESFSSNKLILQSVSRDDEGNYSCAVRGDEQLKSPDFTLMILTGNNLQVAVSKAGVNFTSVSVILLVVIGICIRRKRATSDVQNNTNLQHHRTVRDSPAVCSHLSQMESSEGIYMTLDPKTMSADYDTLNNVRKPTDNR